MLSRLSGGLKSALTPSITESGALPFISQTVRVVGWLVDGVLDPPEHAAPSMASAARTAPSDSFRSLIDWYPLLMWFWPAAGCGRCGFAAGAGRPPAGSGHPGRASGRTRRSVLTWRR